MYSPWKLDTSPYNTTLSDLFPLDKETVPTLKIFPVTVKAFAGTRRDVTTRFYLDGRPEETHGYSANVMANISVDCSRPEYPISYITMMEFATILRNDPNYVYNPDNWSSDLSQIEVVYQFDGVDFLGRGRTTHSDLVNAPGESFLKSPRFNELFNPVYPE